MSTTPPEQISVKNGPAPGGPIRRGKRALVLHVPYPTSKPLASREGSAGADDTTPPPLQTAATWAAQALLQPEKVKPLWASVQSVADVKPVELMANATGFLQPPAPDTVQKEEEVVDVDLGALQLDDAATPQPTDGAHAAGPADGAHAAGPAATGDEPQFSMDDMEF